VFLRSDEASAAIDPLGAQLSALQDGAGSDLLWNGDPAFWSGRAPLLFPIVGTLAAGRYRLGSQSYSLPRHGFARGKQFTLIAADSRAALFRLSADSSTLQIYPFEFELDANFTLQAATLSIETTIRNTGHTPMPASFGYHPALRWPLPYAQARADHYIEFAQDEPDPIRRLDADGLLSPSAQPTPIVNSRLMLKDELFQNDVVILDRVRSRSVTYGAAAGPRVRIEYPDAPYLGLWTKPGAGFICVEPWHGIADPAGFAGDFRNKPGVFTLSPGASQTVRMDITVPA